MTQSHFSIQEKDPVFIFTPTGPSVTICGESSTANMTRSLIAKKNIPLSPEKAGLKLVL